jgi:hypothetical protein
MEDFMMKSIISHLLSVQGPPHRDRHNRFCWLWSCPICQSSPPSLHVILDGERFYCNYCNALGNIVNLLQMENPGLTVTEAQVSAGLLSPRQGRRQERRGTPLKDANRKIAHHRRRATAGGCHG